MDSQNGVMNMDRNETDSEDEVEISMLMNKVSVTDIYGHKYDLLYNECNYCSFSYGFVVGGVFATICCSKTKTKPISRF